MRERKEDPREDSPEEHDREKKAQNPRKTGNDVETFLETKETRTKETLKRVRNAKLDELLQKERMLLEPGKRPKTMDESNGETEGSEKIERIEDLEGQTIIWEDDPVQEQQNQEEKPEEDDSREQEAREAEQKSFKAKQKAREAEEKRKQDKQKMQREAMKEYFQNMTFKKI